MIRMVQSTSAGHAKAYFSDALLKADYYLDDQELKGRFSGLLADRLGVTGPASKETFFALCENVHPATGKPLTPRTKEERITGYDINFHCPKSVSILHALAKDAHILDAFQKSVAGTMRDIEADSRTRVRKGGACDDRNTGELIWADFVHQTARPVEDALPDPHLHSHCFVFNATWDNTEKKIKAGKFRDIKRDMPYYQARFHKRLADRLTELGYQVKRTNTSFEIEGVPQKVIELFSKRTDAIGRVAKEKGITDAKALDSLGAQTRAKKQKGHSMEELKAEWRRQIRALGEDAGGSKAVRFAPNRAPEKASPQPCIDHAVKHCFERASVMPDRRILERAYKFALGNTAISLDGLTQSFEQDKRIIRIQAGGRQLCTTHEVLQEEQRMVELARQGRNKLVPLYKDAPDINLNEQQAVAVQHILTTTNRVSIIRGAAGTGKTTLMREAVELIEKTGKKVTVVAPTGQASRGVLRDEGFAEAATVASLLVDKQKQEKLQNQVLWVDEAGLLGTKDMKALLELAAQKNARLILGGDTRQHASVVRGDALRILNTVGGIESAEVSQILRQKNAAYKALVADLSKGDVKSGFERLDELKAIKTIDPLKANEALVDDYVRAVKQGKTALVISPTHRQGEDVTAEIRDRLRKAGLLGKKELLADRLVNLNLTEAEKGDWRNYSPGKQVQFNQNARGIKRGSSWVVKEATEACVELESSDGKTAALPLHKAQAFDVFEKSQLALAKGDKVQITRNGFDQKDKRLNNGQTLEVAAVTKKGAVLLKTPNGKMTYTLDKDYGHLAHAHCITSYAAQGKTVDEVFISQPSGTFGATDAKQFYVSVSRGRDAAHIYTDDKAALLDHAAELGDRHSALELVARKKDHIDYVHDLQRTDPIPKTAERQQAKDIFINRQKDRDYEPGL